MASFNARTSRFSVALPSFLLHRVARLRTHVHARTSMRGTVCTREQETYEGLGGQWKGGAWF